MSKQKSKVIIRLLGSPDLEFDGDSVGQSGGFVYVFNGGKRVAVINANDPRVRLTAAYVVKEKKKQWRLKLVKE